MAKLPGKTTYSGIRRTTTRTSGFKTHPDATGGEYLKEKENVNTIHLKAGKTLTFFLKFPESDGTEFVGFGGFFQCHDFVNISIENINTPKTEISQFNYPNTSKFGSIWKKKGHSALVIIKFHSDVDTFLALYDWNCGLIWHEAFDLAIKNEQLSYLNNIHSIMPEAGFYTKQGEIIGEVVEHYPNEYGPFIVNLKSCNRCARFLPINLDNEREHLCFSNHCVAKAPCRHKGFGILTNIENNEAIMLTYGYQLECRFCKKYYVNMPLNCQRTVAQMKEDGQRRRNFELLIADIYQSSPQLKYREQTGKELSDDIWKRFNGQCFNCKQKLENPRSMHLDHTRPLALLWPLDGTATALCAVCNTKKRDRLPAEFYAIEQIHDLSRLTGLSIDELLTPEPNHQVIEVLMERLDWFYDEFLMKPALLVTRDGKVSAELIVKALDKVLLRSVKKKYSFSFVDEYNRRRDSNIVFDIDEDTESVI